MTKKSQAWYPETTLARLEELERENELLRNMSERAADFVILIHDSTERGKIIFANDAACKHFGADKKTLLSWTPFDFDPNCDELFFKKLAERMQVGESITFESEHRKVNGDLVSVEVAVHPFEQNGRMLGVSYIQDISERRKIEAQRLRYEALVTKRKVEEHYRSLVETLPDFVVRLDTQARYVYVNPSMLNSIDREESAFLGLTAVEANVTDSPESNRRLCQEALRTIESGEPSVYQDCLMLAGRKACYEIRHIPEKDISGKVTNVLGIARDITEQVKIDDALRFIAQRGWSLVGEPFLTALARYLGDSLGVDCTIIARVADDLDEAEVVAIFAKGEVRSNLRYAIKGTPCENVMNGAMCCYLNEVRQRFPDVGVLDEMGAESYIGLPLWGSDGNVIGLIAVLDSRPIKDEASVSGMLHLVATRATAELERERSERALKAREQDYRRLLDDSPDVIIRYDRNCRRTYSNAAHRRTLIKPASVGTTPIEEWGLPTGIDIAKAYQAHVRGIIESGMPDEWELSWNDAEGKPTCFLVRGTPELDQQGKVTGVLVVGRDISARKRLEVAMLAREQEFRALVENSPDFITRFDSQCRCVYINPSIANAVAAENGLGKTPTECYSHHEPAKRYEAEVREVLEKGVEGQCMFSFTGKDRQHYCYEMRIVPEYDAEGRVVSALSIGRDISERLRLEKQLRHQATYDALTGLPNRWLAGERLREELAKAEHVGDQVALLFIDLDRFKEVNDTLGHEIGDQLLVEAAQRIRSSVNRSDVVARLGGDEFVVILTGVPNILGLDSVAQNIINALTRPYRLAERQAYISASIGIAEYPKDAGNADVLLACADQAMYAAKEQGRNGFRHFTPSMQEKAENRIRLANDLRFALSSQQFQVHYQPILDTVTGQVVKAEALLRWQHPEHGFVSPDLFIPIAEDTGVIHEVGNWVFREAAKLASRWRKQCPAACGQVSVNISPRQFMHEKTVDALLGCLTEMNMPGECMAIEITEGLLLDDQDHVREKLVSLREAGIRVALDDFGTGYSAMGYLKKFNIDYLKIDRSFVRDLARDESDRAIAETIVIMAKRLGMKTIAEGVETNEQRDILAAVECEYVQGYLYSRPLPAAGFLEYVAENMRAGCSVNGG
jgi:diguanylate cyclase (GGDEF)-like protein/PAS domain S-box-containing protein